VSAIADWLIHLADPLGPKTPSPRRALSAAQARELFVQAERHHVLAAVLHNFPFPPAGFETIRAEATLSHNRALGWDLMLRQQGTAVTQAIGAAALPAAIVKGPVFARCLYPDRTLRHFSDIDILAAPQAIVPIGRLLTELGYELGEQKPPGPDPQEWQWIHPDFKVVIEIQTNLVHNAALRAAMSLRYADLVEEENCFEAESPASLLVIAAIHGARHHFERLLHVVDVCQAARHIDSPKRERRLERLIGQTNGRLALVTGLRLAGRVFAEQRCLDLANSIGPVRYANIAGALIDRSVLASTMSNRRFLHSWRRNAYRELLKWGAGRSWKNTQISRLEGGRRGTIRR
jgi:hypothetical protein